MVCFEVPKTWWKSGTFVRGKLFDFSLLGKDHDL